MYLGGLTFYKTLWKQGIDYYSPVPGSLYWINMDLIPGIWTSCVLHRLHYPAGLRWGLHYTEDIEASSLGSY